MEYIILLIIISVVIFFFWQKREKQRKLAEQKRIEEELRKKRELELLHNRQKQEIAPLFGKIESFNKKLAKFKAQQKYLSNFDIFCFQKDFEKLFREVKEMKYKHLPNYHKESEIIESFIRVFTNLHEVIANRNKDFIETELIKSSELLSDVEGKSLDNQQRNAIIVDEDNSLIIAGAGSGKTTTIAGKVKYLTQRLSVNPQNILLISFTRKSADEMAERIRQKMNISLPVKTFHKLGLDIIAESTGEKPTVFGEKEDKKKNTKLKEILKSFIDNAKLNEQYFQNLVDFLAYYLKPYKDIHDFTSDAEHDNYLKEQKLEGYKLVEKLSKDGTQLKYRERFKSQEEVLIANFLFRNKIQYEYEEKYQYKTASKTFGQYKPDFYLPDYHIYIEHFGIDENGNVPVWFKGNAEQSAKEKYNAGIEWKRNEHRTNHTTLIETYSWEQRKGILLSNLQTKLEDKGVDFNPMSDEELWDYIQENTPEDIDVFTQLLNSFLVLFKSNNETIANLKNRAKQEDNQRAILFLQLFQPVLSNYEIYLREQNEIDFSDMINLATKSIRENKYNSPYKYIIIDEFQDISQSRYLLIKSLLDQNPATKLFCVGDDWQSIYRFAGSDIGVFTNFAEYFKTSTLRGFERATNISYIENTYRFDNQIIDVSSNFILKNPNQIEKSLKSNKKSDKKPFTIHKYSDVERNGKFAFSALNNALSEISETEEENKCSVLLLARYDFERKILDTQFIEKRYNRQENNYNYIFKENPNLQINFLTAHKSKGLEADYVVVLNGNSGTYGFPSEIADDPLLNFLLSKADQFPNGEERRLFYVALTRAKKHIHLLSSREYASKFITEIEADEPVTSLKCGWCDNGKLIERKGPYGYFYACNNSHYCNYTRKIEIKDFNKVANEYFNKKDYENAIKYYQKSIEMDKENPKVHYNLGRSYENVKKYDNALKHYNLAIDLGFDDVYVYYWRGSSLFDTEKYNDAINDWLLFNQKNTNKNSVNYWLAEAYFKINHILQALDYVEREIKHNPDNQDAITLKSNYLATLQKRYTTKETKVGTNETNTIKGYIELAIKFDVNVKFDYQKSVQFDNGERSLRTIKPIEFKTIGNSLCVVGFCYMRNENRTFNVERISNLIINPKKIEYMTET